MHNLRFVSGRRRQGRRGAVARADYGRPVVAVTSCRQLPPVANSCHQRSSAETSRHKLSSKVLAVISRDLP